MNKSPRQKQAKVTEAYNRTLSKQKKEKRIKKLENLIKKNQAPDPDKYFAEEIILI